MKMRFYTGLSIILLFCLSSLLDAKKIKSPELLVDETVMAQEQELNKPYFPPAPHIPNNDPCGKPCKKEEKGWDYIIVGGGAAGCILARKLSDDKVTRVLLLEAGSYELNNPIILDPNWLDNANALLVDPLFATTYPIVLGFLSATPYSEGRTLGGGAAHNFLIAVRGTPSIYNLWAAISGNPLWLYFANVLGLMKNLESFVPNDTTINLAERGCCGPISLAQCPPLDSLYPFLNQLSLYTGTPFTDDYNAANTGDLSISAVQQFITPGAPFPPSPNACSSTGAMRSFSGNEFLEPVIDENGFSTDGRKLRVLTKAQALKFHVNSHMRVTSLEYIVTNAKNEQKVKTAKLKKKGELILTAGSVQTPKLLMNSGVGPAAQLAAAGVPLVLDLPQVGQNLQCQYGSSMIVGGLTVPFEALAFLDGSPILPASGERRIMLINTPIGNDVFQVLPLITNPNSRGSVTIVVDNPLVDPAVSIPVYTDTSINPGYISDLDIQLAAYKIVKAAAEAAGGFMISPTPADYASDALLAAQARSIANVVIQSHIVGTAIMDGVVDADLRVIGLKNVRIGDNSVQPQSVNGNTCYGAYIIALVLCQILGVPTPPIL